MDSVVAALRTDYPNARIVLAGHSAGGQFVQRYAASSRARVADIYVPMNPGSYLYMDARRWSKGTLRPLTAKETKACADYDSYKHGLTGRPATLFASATATVAAEYFASPVTYLLGGADTTRDSSLDTSCAADWQGTNRLQRGTLFYAALQRTAGSALNQRLIIVPGVAHEGGGMIRSSEAASVLFGS